MGKQGQTIWIIYQYSSTPETGMGGRHYYLAKELGKLGYKVFLIAASYTHLLRVHPEFEGKYKVIQQESFQQVWLKTPKYKNAHDKKRVWNWFYFSWTLRKLPQIIAKKPDIILYSSPSLIPYLGAQYLAEKLEAKLVLDVRDIWPLTMTEVGGYSVKHPLIRFMQWIEDRAYQRSDIVISNLPYAVEHMCARGMSKSKFHWLPNGFDIEELEWIEKLPVNIEKQLPKGKFIVGYAGTLGEANALETIIETAEILRNDTAIAFVLVGKGKVKKKLEERCRELGLKNVSFIDAIPKVQIQSMLSHFDVCYIGLSPKPLFHYGVSPNKLFDYFAAKKPIIYAIDSGKYEPVEEANAGISIKDKKPESIASAIEHLKNFSIHERAQLGENGYNYAMDFHTYSRLAQRLSDILMCEKARGE